MIAPLDPQRCRDVIATIEAAHAEQGVAIVASSHLGLLIRDLRWLIEDADSHGYSQLASRAGLDQHRAAKAYVKFLQLQNLATSFRALRRAGVAVPRDHRIWWALRKSFDRTASVYDKPHDFLFELEIAGRLARHGRRVHFAEPDVRYRLGRARQPIGFACKRPRNLDRARERITDAADQISVKTRLPGIVVIDLQPLLFISEDPEKLWRYEVASIEHLIDELTSHMDSAAAELAPEIALARARPHVLGVVFAAMGWAAVPPSAGRQGGLIYAWLARAPRDANRHETAARWALSNIETSTESAARRCLF